jgi:hypothetical protein
MKECKRGYKTRNNLVKDEKIATAKLKKYKSSDENPG